MKGEKRQAERIIPDQNNFTHLLMEWNRHHNRRSMPWKGEKDPYKIWLSEIILQQTRVEQGLAYFNQFIETFPDVFSLANAEEKQVYKLWEGLGYYSRCNNLIITAREVAKEMNGVFPATYDGLLKLKGIGSYTASAIASFAYDHPHAVLDGNVMRVLSRVSGDDTPIDTPEGRNLQSRMSEDLLDKKHPALYNQAIMDFGAVVCKPRNPVCAECPLNKTCNAFLTNRVHELPLKKGKMIKKERWMYYLLINHNGKLYVRKRIEKDIWQNLYEFVLFEEKGPVNWINGEGSKKLKQLFGMAKYSVSNVSGVKRQQLTHQTINGQFINIYSSGEVVIPGYELMDQNELDALPFPKFITGFLKD